MLSGRDDCGRVPVGDGSMRWTIRELDDDERAILATLDAGVSDADLAAMLRDLAEILRGKGSHVAARIAEAASARLAAPGRPD